MKIGYARVSTDEQNLDLQRAALEAAGCERVFEDRGISGAESARPGLAAALGALGAGEETRAGVAELFGVDVATLRRAMGKRQAP